MLKPYPFQSVAVDHAVEFLGSASRDAKQLYAAPTGCGKSIVELMVQERIPGSWIVTPRDEIVAGMLEKLGDPGGNMLDHCICTPIKLRNMLLAGSVPTPTAFIFDESHHQEATTWQQLDLLSGLAPAIGYTATPYRGSPRSTRDFLERWGEPLWLITYEEAAAEGYVRMPTFDILPLVDDDIVEVRGGEFDVESLEAATVDRLGDLAEQSRAWYSEGRWTKPTIFACPTSTCMTRLMDELGKRGLPAAAVSAATPRPDRQAIFAAATDRILALLHINIVQEGVDLPLRRLVDLAPTMSPVKWVQQLGRITRPTAEQPEYIGTNRNLLRHAYVLEGIIPTHAIAAAEKQFGRTERAHVRVLGLEAIGRFKPASVRLISGAYAYVYSLSVPVGTAVVQFCAIVHPTMEPIWATRADTKDAAGVKQYGRWVPCDPPSDLRGFASNPANEPSAKQAAWWSRSARSYGLDPEQDLNRKCFQALPVLVDLGLRLQ